MEVIKFKLTLAYDGTRYQGWQAQKTGLGIQQKVEEALRRLFPSVTRIHSASRTDTGVHALGMVAHVEVLRAEWRIPAAKLPLAINAYLPEDIRVMAAARCPAVFHARFHAIGKQYRYWIWNHRVMNPLLRHLAWHIPRPLDTAAMRAAARVLVGRHDFRSFAANRNYPMRHTVRTLRRLDIRRQGPQLTFIIEGDGFLYKMCRGLVGTLAQVGLGKIKQGELAGILAGRDRRLAGMTAPAHGLVLWKVYYARTRLPPQPSAEESGMEEVE